MTNLTSGPSAALPRSSVSTQTDKPKRGNRSRPTRRTTPLLAHLRIYDGVITLGFIIFISVAALLMHKYASRLDNSQQDSSVGGLVSALQSPQAVLSRPSLQASLEVSHELRGDIEALEQGYDDESEVTYAKPAARGNKTKRADVIDSSHGENNETSSSAETGIAVPSTSPVLSVVDDGKSATSSDPLPTNNPVPNVDSAASYASVDPETVTYFDVGNFKELLWADKATDDLDKLGFHAIVIHKSLLWMQSFHVLVGPFGGDENPEAARARLETLGFSPRVAKTH